jgi:uncharacterized protein (DUF1800 family)
MTPESIALNRFGLGVQPADPVPADPRRWLLAQLESYEPLPAPWKPLPRTTALASAWAQQQRAVRAAPEDQKSGVREAYLRSSRQDYQAAVGARAASALQTTTPFVERLVHFWANHFAISVDKLLVIGLAGGFEADAIRPHVLGRFEDLLLAAVRHPAMLLYLDQARSTGPNSPAGRRAAMRKARGQGNGQGLNENLAREILELHTLGVRSGYTQDDVTELARALTGWTLPGDEAAEGDAASFRFVAGLHEPDSRTVLGRTYAAAGEEQARAILHDLAVAPATATHIATKLARHFVADEPPASLVRRLADSFTRSGGNLSVVYQVLVTAPETWAAGTGKFKSPWEWSVSAMRALGRRELPPNQVANLMNQLGQPVWKPGSPAGWGDTAAAWAAPDALLRRVELAQRLASQAGAGVDARALAPRILAGSLGDKTRSAIARAESPATALALLLASPEFLRR